MDPFLTLLDAERFAQLLAREELRRSRTDETLAVAVLDVDGIGEINARHGRDCGAKLLRLCVGVLLGTLRSVDTLARTGADEFSVLLHATDARSAGRWANRFEDDLEVAVEQHPAAPITCSIGIGDTADDSTLMQAALRARRRMELIQTVRKLRRAREAEG